MAADLEERVNWVSVLTREFMTPIPRTISDGEDNYLGGGNLFHIFELAPKFQYVNICRRKGWRYKALLCCCASESSEWHTSQERQKERLTGKAKGKG